MARDRPPAWVPKPISPPQPQSRRIVSSSSSSSSRQNGRRSAQGSNSASPNARKAAPNVYRTLPHMEARLKMFRQYLEAAHSQIVRHAIESKRPNAQPVHTGGDLFTSFNAAPATAKSKNTLKIKFQYDRHGGAGFKNHTGTNYDVVCLKTEKTPVPRYFSHHIQVRRSVIAPQTSMAFYPHKGDMDSPRAESRWKGFVKELDQSETRSGLDSIRPDERRSFTLHGERVLQLHQHLLPWLEDLRINKWTLMKHIAENNVDCDLTSEQRANIRLSMKDAGLLKNSEDDIRMFVHAWSQVFKDENTKHGMILERITLCEALCLDEEIRECINRKPEQVGRPSSSTKDDYETFESNLGTYSSLGCLICFNHSCEHGFFTDDNKKERFSLDPGWVSRRLAARHRRFQAGYHRSKTQNPCARECYKTKRNPQESEVPWSKDECNALHSIFTAFACGPVQIDPICHAAALIGRQCHEVHRKQQELDITIRRPLLARSIVEAQNLPWYNRHEKKLSKRHGANKFHQPNWDHLNRDIDDVCALRGCDHDGPCAPTNPNCPCAQKGQFCEKYCGCTVEECAYRFTGCACHSLGKNCFDDQKGEPCICIQLNRECDPDLCGTCGAEDRADPTKRYDVNLHSTGCQNCGLQRGAGKTLVLGQSEMHGYGIYTAEPILKDEFVVEYVGEIVSGEEGDRRYIRRQNLFDGTKPLSFNFTLLKECEVWVDGARYGNLSRFINHIEESSPRCNITPTILLINGGFRIRFKARRNIKAWEELLFDYGEDFDLESDEETSGGHKQTTETSRKNATLGQATRSGSPSQWDVPSEVDEPVGPIVTGKRKRGLHEDDDEEEDYEPTSSELSPSPAVVHNSDLSDPPAGLEAQIRQDCEDAQREARAKPGRGRPRKARRVVLSEDEASQSSGARQRPEPQSQIAQTRGNQSQNVRSAPHIVEISDSEEDSGGEKAGDEGHRQVTGKRKREDAVEGGDGDGVQDDNGSNARVEGEGEKESGDEEYGSSVELPKRPMRNIKRPARLNGHVLWPQLRKLGRGLHAVMGEDGAK